MFWRMTALSASSPVESILDKENFTLEDLLDEEEIIQECKALNSRLINFLRDRDQVEKLLRYIVEEAPEDAESQRVFKFPFIACEIFTCEIDVILKTIVEEDELMDLLFSFLQPNLSHSALLAGYFGKVVVCLMLRKTTPLMNYVQAHQDVLRQLVDLIGITSIMEVLVRLVGADDHMYSNFTDLMQWLADSTLLEMIVDKLNPSSPPEVHANTAETLCAIARNTPSALASKLCSSSFVARIFGHALEDSESKSALVYSLSVCITLLDPKRSTSYSLMHSMRNQHLYEPSATVNQETVSSMLPKLGDLLLLLNVSSDEKILPTTYGELKPPLGKHRLKIVEFIAILLGTRNETAVKELVSSGAIKNILDLFFEYPFNSALHHHVQSIITSCLESQISAVIDHLFQDCNLVGKLVETDKHPVLPSDSNKATSNTFGKQAPRAGNLGHITRISNKLVQLGNTNSQVQAYLQGNGEWLDWEATVLQERNSVENVYSWACGRPTSLQDRTRDSDEDDFQDRDYDVAALANNLSQAFRYSMYENDDSEEVHGSLERDDEDVYFDDESAEVVISSLRLGDDQESSLFTNSNWFTFQDERRTEEPLSNMSERMDEINLNGTTGGSSSSDDDDEDEVVVGENAELVGNTTSLNETPEPSTSFSGDFSYNSSSDGHANPQDEKESPSGDVGSFPDDASNKDAQLSGQALQDSLELQDSSGSQSCDSDWNPFNESQKLGGDSGTEYGAVSTSISISEPDGTTTPNDSTDRSVETETSSSEVTSAGNVNAMEHALKEGTVGEAGALKRSLTPEVPEKENSEEDGAGGLEFNDTNYWRVDQEVAVGQQ